MNAKEEADKTTPVVSALTEAKEINVIKEVYGKGTTERKKYNYDHVFTNFSTQEEVFEVRNSTCT